MEFTSPDQIVVENCIGRGAFGAVFRIRSSLDHNKKYALKRVALDEIDRDMKQQAMQESAFMARLQHENIARLYGCFTVDRVSHLIMELFPNGTMKALIKCKKIDVFPEKDLANWAYQLCTAVEFIHRQNIVHRDIKNEHLFMTGQNCLKLGGFGFAKMIDDFSDDESLIGTPTHMAPELWKQVIGFNQYYNHQTDVWAVGVTLYEIATFKLPFNYATDIDVMYRAICIEPIPSMTNLISREFRELIERGMLNRNPESRLSIPEVLDAACIRSNRR